MKIKRTPEKDEICRRTCAAYDAMHALSCPYTQDLWKQQGWHSAEDFTVATPKEIRGEAA